MKYIDLEKAKAEVNGIGNIANFIKEVICEVLDELPTIELPKQHGRLIDADALKRKIPMKATMIGTDDIEWIIADADTIVEAEEC